MDKASKINESVNFIQNIKNVINSDKDREFIDKFNDIFMLKNEFAFEGRNVGDFSSDNRVLEQAEEKLSTYQFNQGTGKNIKTKLHVSEKSLNHAKIGDFTRNSKTGMTNLQLMKKEEHQFGKMELL